MIGANGAGKSTLLKSTACRAYTLRRSDAAITFAGEPIGGMPAYGVVAGHGGIALVPEGKGAVSFAHCREENLRIGTGSSARPGGMDAGPRLRIVSRARRAPQKLPKHGALRRATADGRARPPCTC